MGIMAVNSYKCNKFKILKSDVFFVKVCQEHYFSLKITL